MKAVLLDRTGPIQSAPLILKEIPDPVPKAGQVRIKVHCCAICRTDLHIVEGELEQKKLPIIPGHQIVGKIDALGEGATRFKLGQRVGVAWLGSTCGVCEYCITHRENLCISPGFTGYDLQGGYSEFTVAREDFVYLLPDLPSFQEDVDVAPLLCAGIIGYRALKRTLGDQRYIKTLGIFGFGSSAHIVIQLAVARGLRVFVVSRAPEHCALARELGAVWAGTQFQELPERLDSAILFAPAGELVPPSLESLKRGGRLAIAGIHLSQIPELNYQRHLFYERDLRSVTANTREDGVNFLKEASEIGIKARVTCYALRDANRALLDLKEDRISGTGMLLIS